jgi:hypothetical protein
MRANAGSRSRTLCTPMPWLSDTLVPVDAAGAQELWLRLCADQSFSDRAEDDQQSTLAFQAAAQFCADQVTDPTLDFAQEDGLFPLISDFR